MKYTKKLIAMLLAVMMVLGAVPSVFAADVNEAGSTGTVPVQVSAAATTFSVGLPTSLPVYVSADHAITHANDVQILNNCYGMVNVKNVAVTGENNWELVSFDTDFRTVPVDVKQFGMTIQEAEVSAADGSCDATAFESIVGYKDLDITYDAVVAVQSEAVAETIANVVFTIGWDEVESTPAPEPVLAGASFDNNADGIVDEFYTWEQLKGKGYDITDTSVGDYAFSNCNGLTSITIPNSVEIIGEGAFATSPNLTSVTIPGNGETSIGYEAFWLCENLTNVTIGDGVTSIVNRAFCGCSKLASVTIGSSVESIGKQAFAVCQLADITVASGNTVYDSRNSCNAIIETATNTLILGCKNTVIPDSVTSIGESAFSSCNGLTSITIPNSVTSIGKQAFSSSKLTSITISDRLETIEDLAFYYCKDLTSITFQGTKAQWNSISKGDRWNDTTGAYTIHCTDGDISK